MKTQTYIIDTLVSERLSDTEEHIWSAPPSLQFGSGINLKDEWQSILANLAGKRAIRNNTAAHGKIITVAVDKNEAVLSHSFFVTKKQRKPFTRPPFGYKAHDLEHCCRELGLTVRRLMLFTDIFTIKIRKEPGVWPQGIHEEYQKKLALLRDISPNYTQGDIPPDPKVPRTAPRKRG